MGPAISHHESLNQANRREPANSLGLGSNHSCFRWPRTPLLSTPNFHYQILWLTPLVSKSPISFQGLLTASKVERGDAMPPWSRFLLCSWMRWWVLSRQGQIQLSLMLQLFISLPLPQVAWVLSCMLCNTVVRKTGTVPILVELTI